MATLKQRLSDIGGLRSVVLGEAADALLGSIEIMDQQTANPDSGHVKFQVSTNALGVFNLNLTPPLNDPREYSLSWTLEQGELKSFRAAISLSDAAPAQKLFDLVDSSPGYGLSAAQPKYTPDQEWLEPIAGAQPVRLTGVNLVLVIKGEKGSEAAVTFSTSLAGPDGIVGLNVEPPYVLMGGTGFGLYFDQGLFLDDTLLAAPPVQASIDGQSVVTPADALSWTGIFVPHVRFYLHKDVPFFGGHAVDAYLAIGKSPTPGIDLAIETKIPASAGRPAIAVRIECHDPSAVGLTSFLPTLVEASMELPLDQNRQSFDGANSITFGAGKPVIARLRFARDPHIPQMLVSLGLESQGPHGILSVGTESGGTGAKAMVAAGALVTALVADRNLGPRPGSDESGVWLHTLLTAAAGLSAFLDDHGGKLVLHGAELVLEGQTLPVGGKVQVKLDYSVDAVIDSFTVGVMSIGMRPDQPFKVRVREVLLTIDPSQSGLDMFHLGVDHASLEIEDPGGWTVQSPGSLFDILGTRSGRGSMWIEIDLRFKLDLGPVKVNGATVRATLDTTGQLSASLRGLNAGINIAQVIQGDGAFQLLPPGGAGLPAGFTALLDVQVPPLGIGMDAILTLRDDMVVLALGVDLPGPIPLANSGLGLFAIGGMFAANAHPRPAPPGAEPVQYQLDWNYRDQNAFINQDGSVTFGLEAVVGTAPDLGFSFSARAGIFLTTPDIVLRGALAGKALSERVHISDRDLNQLGITAKGVIVIDGSDGVTIGMTGSYKVPLYIDVEIPIAARFPRASSDWYIYLGADGPPAGQGRGIGPIRSTVFPDLFPQQADAYLMLRGKGITAWPRGGGFTIPDGFLIAFGFGFQFTMGLEDVLWAEVHARADLLLTTCPAMLAGFGSVGGSLNLGPVSIGVDAKIEVCIADSGKKYIHAELCGHVDLFFFEISGCVNITYGDGPRDLSVPVPSTFPLDAFTGPDKPSSARIVDDRYRSLADLALDPAHAPTVWSDAIPLITFATAPVLALDATQFPGAQSYMEGERAVPLGNELLSYTWTLTSLSLRDVTDGGVGALVPGPLTAAWQYGKSGNAGSEPEAAELALLTYQHDLWIAPLSNGGEGLPQDPLQDLSQLCRDPENPPLVWGLGAGTNTSLSNIPLLTDPVSADPLQAPLDAVVTVGMTGVESLDRYSAQLLGTSIQYTPAHVVMLPAPVLLERQFAGYLQLGSASRFGDAPSPVFLGPGGRTVQIMTIVFGGQVGSARIWLVVDRAQWAVVSNLFKVIDDGNTIPWTKAGDTQLSETEFAVQFISPLTSAFSRVVVSWPLSTKLGILGIGGITEKARDANRKANDAHGRAGWEQSQAAENGPPRPENPASLTFRPMLTPGRLYCIEASLTWTGTLTDIGGNSNTDTGEKYNPVGGPSHQPCTRKYYFRTAPAPVPGTPSSLPAQSDPLHLLWLHKKLDLFEPEMLERHLSGYEPAQTELDRFRKDPLLAHFLARHVAGLADQYGFELQLGLRRVDIAGDEGREHVLAPEWQALTNISLASPADQRRFAVAASSPCKLPLPGATLRAQADLAARAWYEIYVLAKARTAGVNDGRLPGVTFRTSRWNSPSDMMTDLRFPMSNVATPHGDLAIKGGTITLGPAVALDDDAAFDAAFEALGLDALSAVTESRTSRLWQSDGAAVPVWRFAGVLLESPEPIHRPGRFTIDQLTLRLDVPVGGNVVFDLERRDSTGSRILFATSTPVQPVPWRAPVGGVRLPTVVLNTTDLYPAPVKFTGELQIALKPDFAEDPL